MIQQQEISQAVQKEDELLTRTIKVKKSRTPRKDPSLENLREEVQEIYPAQKDDPRYEYIGEHVQTDGYQAYNQFESQNGKLLLGCWAHTRRGFENSLDENRILASEALVQIKELYDIERQAAELGLNYDEIAKLRSEKAYPLLVRFEKWLVDNHSKVLRQSRTGKAIDVNPHHWMSYVLNNIATVDDITQLLPKNYKNLTT